MYIIVRSDLTPGLQTAQAVHAGFSFAQKYLDITSVWMIESQYLVIVQLDSSEELQALHEKAQAEGVASVVWREPDLNNEITAIALEPSAMSRVLYANLPLAGKMK